MARKRKPDKVFPVRFSADVWERIASATKKVADRYPYTRFGYSDFIRQATLLRLDQVENDQAA